MSLFRQYFINCFSTTKATLKSFSLSIKSASVSMSVPMTLRAILSLTPRSTMSFLQGIKNMDIFKNNKCNFLFLGIAFIPLYLSHKLDTQVYSSFLFSKILFCSLSLHDFSLAPWLNMTSVSATTSATKSKQTSYIFVILDHSFSTWWTLIILRENKNQRPSLSGNKVTTRWINAFHNEWLEFFQVVRFHIKVVEPICISDVGLYKHKYHRHCEY